MQFVRAVAHCDVIVTHNHSCTFFFFFFFQAEDGIRDLIVTGVQTCALPISVDLRVARRTAAAGFRVGFTMERALNRTLEEPLLLGRLDANDAPGGKRPLDEIPPARSRYFAEAAPAA